MKRNIVERRLDELIEKFYVRVGLDEERVLFFAELYENGAEVPPLLTTKSGILVDGRTRKGGLEVLNRTVAKCEVMEDLPLAELILIALARNSGGSKPPTHSDTLHTIRLLFDQKMSRRAIVEEVSNLIGLPPDSVKKIVDDVQSNMAKERLNRAKTSVIDGVFKIEEAADTYNVSLDSLRQALSGKKREEKNRLNVLKGRFRKKFCATSNCVGQTMRQAFVDLQKGDVNVQFVRELLDAVAKNIGNQERTYKDWVKRLVAVADVQSRSSGPPKKKSSGKAALKRMGVEVASV